MKPDLEYRPKKPWQARGGLGATPAPGKSATKPKKALGATGAVPDTAAPIAARGAMAGTSVVVANGASSAESELARRKALKAAQMRRYRTKRKGYQA